ncbi:MAG: alanine racemase [Ruminococcus sp.]|nr:alanine racemase [Ruminococcus sp.]
MYRKTYVEVNLDNIKTNAKNIINYYNDYDYYIGVVKGNAYGHGNYVAKALTESGINYIATSSLEEALDIRKYVKTPILILEPIDISEIDICLKNNIAITLSNYDYYKELIKKDLKDLKIHLKINTGMNRLGFGNKKHIKEVYDYLIKSGNLEGIYTHLGTEGILDKYYDLQLAKWQELTSLIDLTKTKIVHIGRSSTLVNHHKIEGTNAIRLGIILYGAKPNPLTYNGFKGKLRKLKHNHLKHKLHISESCYNCPIEIKNTFNLCSEVLEIHEIKKGDVVGYGSSFIADNDLKIAVLPIGYADGLSLKLSGINVKINDKPYKIIGTINCGMITILVDDNVKVHDKAIIIGSNIREVARHTNMTYYAVITCINPLIPRVYLENNKELIIEKD